MQACSDDKVTVTSLQWLIHCLWHTANERSQLGVIQHFQISSALCPIKSSHILPEAACTRQVVSHVEGHLGQRNGGGGTPKPTNKFRSSDILPEAAHKRQVIKQQLQNANLWFAMPAESYKLHFFHQRLHGICCAVMLCSHAVHALCCTCSHAPAYHHIAIPMQVVLLYEHVQE